MSQPGYDILLLRRFLLFGLRLLLQSGLLCQPFLFPLGADGLRAALEGLPDQGAVSSFRPRVI